MKQLIFAALLTSVFTLGMAQQTMILPISLKNFTVNVKDQNTVEVKWDIIHQNNAKGYSVEHSMDGKNWQAIGYLEDPRNDHYKSFSFSHNNVGNGNQYYRVRLVDFSGELSYSLVKIITVKSKTMISTWPNPAQNILHIRNNNITNKVTRAIVYNQHGKSITEVTLSWGLNEINIQKLAPGNYFIRVQGESNNYEVFQFIKQ